MNITENNMGKTKFYKKLTFYSVVFALIQWLIFNKFTSRHIKINYSVELEKNVQNQHLYILLY